MKNPTQQKIKVLKPQTNWKDLWFYKKSVVLYQLTYVFTRKFLPSYGDRTVDQMLQAARSGKQNIVEGTADGVTSTEMELKLLNVATFGSTYALPAESLKSESKIFALFPEAL